ncbi:hypothetical protein Niako_1873 [Niastella koreensis GR20-10]|uniref:Uncharacterized protein n=1 Tax=Niastella koreensis (strain DSM 17620 / KACC 11465 / NBRC 106392 / GR20-10) TaxID=700598 RepID=G8TBU9_NIAKG|nr:hypothetical protein [Niastella koreensis]AEV98231.1 hypothetical protein Niako_1873 [Niastella koreensis GR20-10]
MAKKKTPQQPSEVPLPANPDIVPEKIPEEPDLPPEPEIYPDIDPNEPATPPELPEK